MSALQYSWYFFEALVKSMAQYLIESCKVKVSLPQHVHLTQRCLLMSTLLQLRFLAVVNNMPSLVDTRSQSIMYPVCPTLLCSLIGCICSYPISNHIPVFNIYWHNVEAATVASKCSRRVAHTSLETKRPCSVKFQLQYKAGGILFFLSSTNPMKRQKTITC